MSSEAQNKKVKMVVIGDGSIGKTCMIMCFAYDKFPDSHTPTVFDNHKGTSNYKGQDVVLDIWDTAGQADLGRMRPVVYPNTDIFLVGFSLVDRESFKNACTMWANEYRGQGPHNCPALLVGLKSDLRDML